MAAFCIEYIQKKVYIFCVKLDEMKYILWDNHHIQYHKYIHQVQKFPLPYLLFVCDENI